MGEPISINTSPSLEPESVASREFPTTRRGYDQSAVRRYLADIAQQLRALRARESELQTRLSEAEQRAAAPLIDEETVSSAVGAETARILHTAHAAGTEVLAKAEARAGAIIAEAESAARDIRHRAETDANAAVADSRHAAAAAVEAAKTEGRGMLEEARDLRRRVLADLSERRRTLTAQIEQLRAGKDTLSSAVSRVAEAINEVQASLDGSEEEARVAAESVRRRLDFEHGEVSAETPQSVERVEPVAAAAASEGPAVATSEIAETQSAEAVQVEGDDRDPALVDELFARLRASGDAEAEQSTSLATGQRDESDEEHHGPAPAPETVAGAEPEKTPEGGQTESTRAIIRRDELAGSAGEEVVHALKRALRVEQNELLHRLRSLGRGKDPLGLLDTEAAAKSLTAAATPGLVAAFEAGLKFSRERLDGTSVATGDGDAVTAHATAERVASGLSDEIATAIGRRLEEALKGAGEQGSLQQAVGATYRGWKGDRLESAAGDYVTSAFAQGVLHVATATGAEVTWIFDDESAHCPDCEDDELAGAVAPGATFPTGQVHPPAHGGCRCVLAPVRS